MTVTMRKCTCKPQSSACAYLLWRCPLLLLLQLLTLKNYLLETSVLVESFTLPTPSKSSSRTQQVGLHTVSSQICYNSIKLRQSSSCFDTTRLHMIPTMMIGNIFGGGDSKKQDKTAIRLPRDVKEAVSKCRQATQKALQDRTSRMNIEFPVGTKFGVEKVATTKKGKRLQEAKSGGDDSIGQSPTLDDLTRSDRELARLYVDMFQPVGGDNIAVVFSNVALADAAKQQWKNDATAVSRILAVDRRQSQAVKKKQKQAQRSKGFAAKIANEIESDDNDDGNSGPFVLPQGTEVAIFVAPTGPKELAVIEKTCREVGMGTLVILLNARVDSISASTKTQQQARDVLASSDFVSVFHLAAASQQHAPDCLLYHEYGQPWIMARKPKVGSPVSVLSTPERPTVEEQQAAYDALDISIVEKGVESALGNIAQWFV